MEIVTLYTNQDGIELFYDRESFFASYDNTGKEFEIKLAKCFVKPFNDDVVEVKGNAVLFNLKRCEIQGGNGMNLLENRKQVLKLQISDAQKQIDSLLRTILNQGVDKIHSNTVDMVMPSLIQAQHRLSQLEVELHTLNAFEHYKEDK